MFINTFGNHTHWHILSHSQARQPFTGTCQPLASVVRTGGSSVLLPLATPVRYTCYTYESKVRRWSSTSPGCPHDGAYCYDVGVRLRLLASGLARGTPRRPDRMSPSLRFIALPSTVGDLRRERFSKGHCTCRLALFLT